MEARLYEKLPGKKVRCYLCNHRCNILPGKRGVCMVRENQSGKLISLVYKKLAAANIDPIEKKPLFHFLPGSRSYSISTVGCNFRCEFCQNWDISQASKDNNIFGRDTEPRDIVEAAVKTGCDSISYTYTEPTIFYEYAEDCGKPALEKGLKNVFVSNGFMTEECLKAAKPWLHALNIDLKSFSDQFYRKVCGARLEPVLESLKIAKKMGFWVEVTTLVVPTQNDSKEELRQCAQFIAKEMGRDVPWHLSAFHPDYKMTNLPPTPSETLLMARQLARDEGLKYVYIGNIYVPGGEDTVCPKCKEVLVRRSIFTVEENKLKKGACPSCKTDIEGVWG